MWRVLVVLWSTLANVALGEGDERPPGSPGTATPQPYVVPAPLTMPRTPSGHPPLLPPLPPAQGNPRQESLPSLEAPRPRRGDSAKPPGAARRAP